MAARPKRVRRSGTRYDYGLRHSDPTSLDPDFIVKTGTPVDDEPGRTARLSWRKGRRQPITEREAYNVFWRRRAARLKQKHHNDPARLERELAALPQELPPWDETRTKFTVQLPARLAAFANAYMDIQQCSMPQLVELLVYEAVTADVRSPKEFAAAYDRMREQTYQDERERARAVPAQRAGDDEDDE